MTQFTEERGEHAIALALRYGSLISTLVMALGLLLMALRGTPLSRAAFHRVGLSVLFSNLLRFDPAAVTEFGVLLLLLTPLFRIVVAVVSFALERELKYVLIALGVLIVVLLSISFAIEA
jgi:uncharacterized membrane protein